MKSSWALLPTTIIIGTIKLTWTKSYSFWQVWMTPNEMDYSLISCSNFTFDSYISSTFKSSVAVGGEDLLCSTIIFSTIVISIQSSPWNSSDYGSSSSTYSLLAYALSTHLVSFSSPSATTCMLFFCTIL